MGNIHVNFMPGTFNNLLKLARANKRQTKPVVDDFMAGEEYEKLVQSTDNEADIKSNADADEEKSRNSSNLDYNLLHPHQSNIPVI
jgi:fibrillarin-like rRNA methylase